MAYPTTLALITALWSGPARTKSIALWSGTGGAIAALGPLLSGLLLEHFWWGSVFLITLPLAVVAIVMAWFLVPAHVNETTRLGRQPRRDPLGRARRRVHPLDQLRARPEQGRPDDRARPDRGGSADRVLPPPYMCRSAIGRHPRQRFRLVRAVLGTFPLATGAQAQLRGARPS
jgi:MFS family permease